MKLALYHPWVYLTGGIERMILELFRRSRHEWVLYTHHYDHEHTFAELADHDVAELRPRVSVERSLIPLARAAWTIATAKLPVRGEKALLVSSEGLGDLIMARAQLPAACYCHTPLKILHDPSTRARLRIRDAGKARASSILGPGFTMLDRLMWKRFRHVFVGSEEIKARVGSAGLAPAGPVETLPPGVDREWFSDDGGPREAFLLVAGRIKWLKNIELAIAGLSQATRDGAPLPLVIAGSADRLNLAYLDGLRRQANGLPVRFELDPSDERLRDLYRRCRALVFPSLNEDFGMVPLEAMACGAPVIAVDAGGPRETIKPGETGWLVAPTPEAFSRAILEASAPDGRTEQMRHAARARAAEYSWDRFARRVDDVMELLGSEHAERPERLP